MTENKPKWEIEFERLFTLNKNGDLELNFTDDTSIPKDDKQLLKSFISSTLQNAITEERERINSRVGILRQLLNEERITDPNKMIDNEYIRKVLSLIPKTEKECEHIGECYKKTASGSSMSFGYCKSNPQ